MIPAENLSAFIQLVVKIDDCYCEQNKFKVFGFHALFFIGRMSLEADLVWKSQGF